jgi:hypothetical protein
MTAMNTHIPTHIPTELQLLIVSKVLDDPDVFFSVNYRLVCKEWNEFILTYIRGKVFHNYSSLDYKGVQFHSGNQISIPSNFVIKYFTGTLYTDKINTPIPIIVHWRVAINRLYIDISELTEVVQIIGINDWLNLKYKTHALTPTLTQKYIFGSPVMPTETIERFPWTDLRNTQCRHFQYITDISKLLGEVIPEICREMLLYCNVTL